MIAHSRATLTRRLLCAEMAALLSVVTSSSLWCEDARESSEKKKNEVPAATEPSSQPIPVRFQGLLPGNVNPNLEGKLRVVFRIYPSPQGGQPEWREELEVEVHKGNIDVLLGKKTPIPMKIHEATYKWLGASVNGQREIYPRYPIVNVVYASLKEALLAHEKLEAQGKPGSREPGYAGKSAPSLAPAARESPMSWKEALERARKSGGDLPDYEEWYAALESLPVDKTPDWAGHYEWVLPWVYDTASHGRFNNLFRGRFQGCDYSDLSPDKKYCFRLAHAARSAGTAPRELETKPPAPGTRAAR